MKAASFITLVACGALAGCAALGKADKPVTMRLSPGFPTATPNLPGSIAVAPVQARGVTAALRYAYIDSAAPGEIRQAASLFWEEPPPRVIERALVAGLKTRFVTVSGPAVPVPADQRIAIVLTRFEETGAGGAARAVVAFDATVVKDGKITRSGSFYGSMPIDTASATLRARAFEGAIGTAVEGVVQLMATGSAPAPAC